MASGPDTSIKTVWSDNIDSEVNFWRYWFREKGGKWPDAYLRRQDPAEPLQDYVAAHLDPSLDRPARILDVGAGPLTVLGKVWKGGAIEITATDALACEYDKLIEEFGVQPLVRTMLCDGEQIASKFPEGHFDIAHARNCLDHAYDPMEAIRQMVGVTRSGGVVLLAHNRNESVKQGAQGLHQWNFDAQEGRFIIWREDLRIDATAELEAQATTECNLAGPGENFLNVIIRKR